MRLHTCIVPLALLANLATYARDFPPSHAANATLSTPSAMPTAAEPGSPGALVLLPSRSVRAEGFGDGCWVHMFDGINYRGQQLTLVGPMRLPDMSRTGTPWRDWDSVVVGPRAAVTIYIVADFGLPVATFTSGQRIADLTGVTGRFEDINSVEVKCIPKP